MKLLSQELPTQFFGHGIMLLYESSLLAFAFITGLLIKQRLVGINSSGRRPHPNHRWLHNIVVAETLLLLLLLQLIVGGNLSEVYLDLTIFVLTTVVADVNGLTILILVGVIGVQTILSPNFISILLLLLLNLRIRQINHNFFRSRIEII